MNYQMLLQKAWRAMRANKALWIFGVVLALTTASVGPGVFYRESFREDNNEVTQWHLSPKDQEWVEENLGLTLPQTYTLRWDDLNFTSESPLRDFMPTDAFKVLFAFALAFVAIILTMVIISLIARYVAETALIRLVNEGEKGLKPLTIRQGLRYGFSWNAVRLFLIQVIVYATTFVLILTLFAPIAAAILALLSIGSNGVFFGAFFGASLFFPALAAAIVVATVGRMVVNFAWRAVLVEEVGIFGAIARSVSMIRHNLKETGIVWLIMTALEMVSPLLAVPVVILLIGLGVAVVIPLILLVGFLGSAVVSTAVAWVSAGLLGGFTFLFILVTPLVFLEGLLRAYQSTTWTLTFRELIAMESLEPAKFMAMQPA